MRRAITPVALGLAGTLVLAGFSSAAVSDRSEITTGSVTMTVEDPARVARELSWLVEGIGGRVESLERRSAPERPAAASATLVLRIPSAEVSSTLGRLDDYGTVEDLTVNRSDVTMAVRDLAARIQALETSVEMAPPLELESLLAEQAVLADQVSMSTVEVRLQPPREPETPVGSLPVVGVLVVVLVFAALVSAVVMAVVRRNRRQAATTPPRYRGA